MKEEKEKKTRAQKYEFTGGGVQIIDGQRIYHGDTVLLKKEDVTCEYKKVNKSDT